MSNSMTGFGRGEACGSGYQVSIELKSVNHRFLEIVVRIPRNYNSFEERIRKVLQDKFQRGRIEVHVNMVETEERKRLVKVDNDLALSYDKTLKDLSFALHTEYETDIYRLVSFPEVLMVIEPEIDLAALWQTCSEALSKAVDGFEQMRRSEGDKLTLDLLQRLDLIAENLRTIAERAPYVVTDYQERLQERLQTLLGEVELDGVRLANEVVYFADRGSITEELVRFDSHLAQSREALRSEEPVGRKLDFLVQEMNREINTIGSKANDLMIGQRVIKVKSELEKVREQVQNLE
ncbi:YicC/YloC family endoribonuclease [Desulfosporosinus meridiei]|uniref:TIGR00255 family protein n=1 Tax=Desulfosporosinus meridiei (strain ATCC BAA-275 / DSM 13257 / KCTC 12902 / NCIMB 13706 / S10) TaxID=768704 RepID=J7IV71_DESMD|nr:YicC/YloC family endoribonuclease [Desulfosporosinus meridiei]AFQ45630.1 TIGR00255 family protein [Desulfosporosinus meridiei DSM 13257]